MTRQATSVGVRGVESELLSHPHRCLVEEHVVSSAVRNIASQPGGRLATDQRLAAMTACRGATSNSNDSMRRHLFRGQASRGRSGQGDCNQAAIGDKHEQDSSSATLDLLALGIHRVSDCGFRCGEAMPTILSGDR